VGATCTSLLVYPLQAVGGLVGARLISRNQGHGYL